MAENYNALQKCELFMGIEQDKLSFLLGCLSSKKRSYHKGEVIFLSGSPVKSIGIVLEGQVQVVHDDVFGNRTIVAKLAQGDLFGEAFACAKTIRLPVSVEAVSPCNILLIDYQKVISTCPTACPFHVSLIENMVSILASKNVLISRKLELLSKRTTRDKILSFLSWQAEKTSKTAFVIDFNRQDMADYLCVDRSAMSAELGRLRDEGILEFHKNEFKLLDTQFDA